MSYLSATEMGKVFDLSYHKVNKVLAEKNLYDKETRRPTPYAIENGFAEIKSTVSRFTGRTVEFNVWDFSKLETILSKIPKQKKVIRCRNPLDAYLKICDAFSDYGRMLKIERNNPIKGISEDAQYAVVQAYFIDLSFLHGPLLHYGNSSPQEVEKAKFITSTLAKELFIEAKKVNAAKAQSIWRTIEAAMQWL